MVFHYAIRKISTICKIQPFLRTSVFSTLVATLNNFIKSFFENSTGVSLETQHDLQYIGVQISDNLKQERKLLQRNLLQRKRKSLHNIVTSKFRQNQEYYLRNADRILSDREAILYK